MKTIVKVGLVVGGVYILSKLSSSKKIEDLPEGELSNGGGGGGFAPSLPIMPLGIIIPRKSDAELKAEADAKAKAEADAKAKAEAEAKAKAVLDEVQKKIEDAKKAVSSGATTTASGGTIGEQLGTSTSGTSTGGSTVGSGTSASSGVGRAGAPTPIGGGIVPFDGTINSLRRKPKFY